MNGPQLRAMLWLRWRLSSRQWQRGDMLGAAIALLCLVIGVLLAIAGCIAGLLAGAWAMNHASSRTITIAWDGLVAMFLFLWTMGLVAELQRSEIIDLTRLMHLPVSLRDVFILNYVASHVSFSLALMAPAMLGLSVGLAFGQGAMMLLLLPLVAGFFFMITAWTYCLRGWLASLMVNKRRRRAIIVTVSMIFVLVSQLPNLLMNAGGAGRHNRSSRESPVARQHMQAGTAFEMAHRAVPFLWLPRGAGALARGRILPALWGALGMATIGALGLGLAYRSTIRFYRGQEKGRPQPTPVATTTRGTMSGKLLVERALPGVPEEASVMAFAGFRSMSRAPEVKMALAMNMVIFAILCLGPLFRMQEPPPPTFLPFIPGVAVAVTFLGLIQLMFNSFGFDRSAFRALVLTPAPRRHIVMGKNLNMLPVAIVVFGLNLVLVAIFTHLGLLAIVLAAFEFVIAFLILSVLGNLLSILVPHRISPGSMKPTKTRGLTQLLIVATHLLFPVAMLPVFLPAGLGMLAGHFHWFPAGATSLIAAAILAALAAIFYWLTLAPLGRLLQRREQTILQIVTQEVE